MFRVPERCKTNGLDFHSHEVDWNHSSGVRVSPTLCCWPDGSQFPGELNELEKNPNEKSCSTVDGQNPAPPRMMIIPLFIGF